MAQNQPFEMPPQLRELAEKISNKHERLTHISWTQ